MNSYKKQLDALFSKAQKSSAGQRLLSEDDIRNLLVERAPTTVPTTHKTGNYTMIITTAATGIAAILTAGALFLSYAPHAETTTPVVRGSLTMQEPVMHDLTQHSRITLAPKHFSTPGIASKEKAGRKQTPVSQPAAKTVAIPVLVNDPVVVDAQVPVKQMPVEQMPVEQIPVEQMPVEQIPVEQMLVEEEHNTIDVRGVRMLELSADELKKLGVDKRDDAVYVYQRHNNTSINVIGVTPEGVVFHSMAETRDLTVLSFDHLRMITDDLGNRRIEQYSDGDTQEEGSSHSNNSAITNQSVQAGKWIAISISSNKPQDASGKTWRTNYVLWYEPTPEVLAALPERYRTEIERELNLATSVEDQSSKAQNGGFIGMWQTKSGAVSASSVYPNPVKKNTPLTLSYTLSSPRNVTITLRSITGAVISQWANIRRSAGTWTEQYNTGDLVPGMYLVSIETNNGEYSVQRIIAE